MIDFTFQQIIGWIQNEGYFRMIEHLIVVIVLLRLLSNVGIQSRGKAGIKNYIVKVAIRISKRFSFYRNKIENQLATEAAKNIEEMLKDKKIKAKYSNIPEHPQSKESLLAILDERVKADVDPTKGRTFAYVYEQSKKHSELVAQCFNKYIHSNALNPIVFNSLRVIQSQVIRMSSNLFNGDDECVGNVTTCGTESLLLAMKTYRDYRGPGEIIMCTTGHPGINKGCYYVGLNITQITYGEDMRMSLSHLRKAISSKTVLVVCSAPQYPHGVIDDVEAISNICLQYGVPLHVDAAIGGFIVPFIEMERKGKIKPWDFRVKGVTSINADLHKYGYAPKGSSVLIYRSSRIRRKQFYSFSTWPGGIYISPTAIGSRNGGCLSSAWGSLLGLGIQGFRSTTRVILQIVDQLLLFIQNNPQLKLIAIPDSSIISFTTLNFSCYKLADAMEKRGFTLQKQSNPDSLHMSVMPMHSQTVNELIKSLEDSINQLKQNPSLYENKTKAVYGSIAKIPDQVIVEDFMVYYMDQLYKYR